MLNAAEVPGTDVVGEPPPPLPPRCRRCVLPWLHRSLCMALLAGSAAARFTSTRLFVSAEIGCRRVYSMGATLAHRPRSEAKAALYRKRAAASCCCHHCCCSCRW